MKKSSSKVGLLGSLASTGVISRRTLRLIPEAGRKLSASILAVAALIGFNPQALAATQTFTGSGTLNSSADWNAGAGPVPGTADIALFNSNTAAGTYLLGSSLSVGELQFTNPTGLVAVGGDASALNLTLNGVDTALGNNIGIDMSTDTFNVAVGSPNDAITIASAQTWLVNAGSTLAINGTLNGTANVTIGSSSGGSAGTVIVGAGDGGYTGNFIVNNGATLTATGAQSATVGYILNGNSSLTTNQSLGSTNTITANTGLDTFTSSTLFNGNIAGSANLIFSPSSAQSTSASINLFTNFGGTAFFGTDSASFRVSSSSAIAPYTFATLNYGTGSGGIYEKGGANDTIILGGVASTTGGILFGNNGNSGATINIVGSANTNLSFGGVAQDGGTAPTVTNSVIKVGTGTWTVSGLWTNTGATSANGGTLAVNLATHTTGVLHSGNAFNFGGGSLLLQGATSGVSSQTVGAVTVTGAGGASLIVNPDGGTSTTLTMGTLTATALGGALNIQPVDNSAGAVINYGTGTATITTTTNKSADGTYGGRITFGSDWATTTTSTPFTLSAYSAYNVLASGFTGGSDTTDDEITPATGGVTLTSNYTTNSLKINNSSTGTLALGGFAAVVTNGGLLFAGSAPFTIGSSPGDGTLNSAIASTSDLIIQDLSTSGLTINSTIVNGVGASQLTKAGFGTLTLTGTNTYTGVTNLTGGVVSISSDANLGAIGTGAALEMNGGTLQATSSFTLDNGGASKRNVAIFGGGGTFDVTPGNTLIVDGIVSTASANQFGPLIKTDSGVLTLSGANTYSGATIISGGEISVASMANGGSTSGIGNSNGAAPSLILDSGSLQYTGGVASSNRLFTLTQNGGTLDSEGSGALTFSSTLADAFTGSGNRALTLSAGSSSGNNIFANQIVDATTSTGTGTTAITKIGPGEWTLSNSADIYSGATNITAGTLALSAANNNNIPNTPTINIGSGATLNVTALTSSALASTLVLVSGQTITGAGTITGALTVGSNTTITPGTVTAGNAGTGVLTLGNLTIGTGSTFNFGLSSSNIDGSLNPASDNLISAAAITLSGTGTIQLYQPGTTSSFTTPGTYDLFQYTSLTGSPAADFAVGSTSNSAFSYTFGSNGTDITLTIVQTGVSAIWNTNGSGNWSSGANWSGGVPHAAGDNATFGNVITAPATVTLDTPETVGQITFASANSYTIASANTLTLDNKGNGASIVVSLGSHSVNVPVALNDNVILSAAGGSTLTMGGQISNSSASKNMTINGGGTVILATSNSYGPASGTVGTTLNGATVQVQNNSSLSGGDISVTGNGTIQAGASGLNVANNIITGGAVTTTVDDQGNTFTLSGLISQAATGGALTKIGAGTVILTQNETYSGVTTISNGALQLGNGGSTGSVAGSIVDNGSLSLNQSTNSSLANLITGAGGLTQNGTNNVTISNAGDAFFGSTVINSGTLTLGAGTALQNSTLNYNNQGGTLSFGGVTSATLGALTGAQSLALTNTNAAGVALSVGNNNSTGYSGSLSGAGGSLTKLGTGTLTLTGSNSYSGSTSVSNGNIILGTGGSINGGAVFISGGNLSVTGGTLISSAASTVAQALFFSETSGSAAFNGGISSTSTGGDGAAILISGGNFTATSVAMSRTNNTGNPGSGFLPPAAIPTASGFVVTGGTAVIGSVNITNGANSSATAYFGGGSTTVTGNFLDGQETSNRFNYTQVAGGSLTVSGTMFVGIGDGASQVASELYQTGGVATYNQLALAAPTDTVSGTSDFVMQGGTMYIGAGGITQGDTALTGNFVLEGGTIGAITPWSSSVPVNLFVSGSNATFQAADSLANANNIVLSGGITGAGGLIKTGAGTLTLSTAAASYTGATVVSGGTLLVTSAISATSSASVNGGADLELGANNALSAAAHLTLATGTLQTLANETENLSDLTVGAGTSSITLASTGDILHFADSSADTWTGSLQITDWNGSAAGGGSDQIFFGSTADLTNAQLADITFVTGVEDGSGFTTTGATQLPDGEIVAAAVPEPGTWASLLGGLGVLVAWQRSSRRRRS